ncbi:hypothetical protein [Candidatus Phytoplasma pini]|uniref:Uncharacterized protein n=1 Tax=Candidatus Phytoplasma pini TaxID=267362 RepID=A0A559KIY5_9MOLU|nr:hypothetical protein [Candidatus Phytoplasma pini]TVY12091.1 hypothetical protein MDPP_00378 [Candidatus Phytoplasma pini]
MINFQYYLIIFLNDLRILKYYLLKFLSVFGLVVFVYLMLTLYFARRKFISILKSKRQENLPMSYYLKIFAFKPVFCFLPFYSVLECSPSHLRKAGFSSSQISEFISLKYQSFDPNFC